ncbi:DUF2182 domain-containing protein [Undibacterium sp. JH2W]|uniref:copper chaperone n=1 Tax=Undibacterium sp. JH2W TaxID=3413037 RepID=UPI003BF1F52A
MLNKLLSDICLAWKPLWTPPRPSQLLAHLRSNGQLSLPQMTGHLLKPEFWQNWLARYPQTWLWLWSGLAWTILVRRILAQYRMPDICSSTPQLFGEQFFNMGISWGLMIAAMMLPLLSEQVQHVASRMPSRMRNAAIHWFLLAYILQWLLTGLLVYVLSSSAFTSLSNLADQVAWRAKWRSALPTLGFALAAAWVYSPMKRAAQLSCSRTIPMRIQAWGAGVDSMRFGILSANFCLRTCWAPMLALMLAQHGILLMMLVASLLTYERYFLNYRSRALAHAWASMALAFLLLNIFKT